MFNFSPVQQQPGRFKTKMTRRETPIFFVLDHNLLKKEDDDLKDAILYFCPEDVSADLQCELCGQLMGMVAYLNNTISMSAPQIFKFEHNKFALKHMGTYSLVRNRWGLNVFATSIAPDQTELSRSLIRAYTVIRSVTLLSSRAPDKGIECPNFGPDSMLVQQLAALYKTFVFYHGSIDSLRLRHKDNHMTFLHELHSIWRTILGVSGFSMSASLPQTFQQLSYLELPKSSSHLFLQASHLLQSSQKRPYVLAGAILYKHRVLSTQLSPDLTRHLTFLQQQMPHIVRTTDLDLPVGCRIITVFLTEDELTDIMPPHPLAHRNCRITDFTSHQGSDSSPSNMCPQSMIGKLTRRQTFPNQTTNLSDSQAKAVSERAMQSFLARQTKGSQSMKSDSLPIERFTWRGMKVRKSTGSLSHVPIVECQSGESPIDSDKEMLGHSADESHFSDNYKDLERRQDIGLTVASCPSSTTTDNDEPLFEQPIDSKLQQPTKSKNKKQKVSKNISKNIKDQENSNLHMDQGTSKHRSSVTESKNGRSKVHSASAVSVHGDPVNLSKKNTFPNEPIDKYAKPDTDKSVIQVTVEIHEEESRNSRNSNDADVADTSLTSGEFNIEDKLITEASLNSSDFNLTKDLIDNEQSEIETQTEVTVNNEDTGCDLSPTHNSSDVGYTNNSTGSDGNDPESNLVEDKDINKKECIQKNGNTNGDTYQSDNDCGVANEIDSHSYVSEIQSDGSKMEIDEIESEGKTDTDETNQFAETNVTTDTNLQSSHSCASIEVVNKVTEIESDVKIDINEFDKHSEKDDCTAIDSDMKSSEVNNTQEDNSKLGQVNDTNDKRDTAVILYERLDVKTETEIGADSNKGIEESELSDENTTTSAKAIRPDNLNLITSNSKLETSDLDTEPNADVGETLGNKENVDPSSLCKSNDTCPGINATVVSVTQLDDYLTETDDETIAKVPHNPCINCLDLNSNHPNESNGLKILKCPQCLSKSNSYKTMSPYGARKEVIDFGETEGQDHHEGQSKGEEECDEVDNTTYRDQQAQTSAANGVSLTSSFSSDVSTDSTISRFWTHEMDCLNDVTLYVQCHSDISLLLLIENPEKYEENLLHSLWKGSLSHLADLDFYIRESLDHSDDEAPADSYSYVKFDTYLRELKGNIPEKSNHAHGRMHHAMSTLHSDFQRHQCLTDVTLKSQSLCLYSHRNSVDETYFQLDQPQKPSSGWPIDRDPTFSLDNIARQKLSRDKHISIL